MKIEEGVALAPLSTFRIGGSAAYFAPIRSIDDLRAAVKHARENGIPMRVIGGGSNVLFGDGGVEALVARMEIGGIDLKSDRDSVLVIAGGGESWDVLVSRAVSEGLWGIENLSGIPGTVGASPIQNIGAYGKEIGSVIEWIEAFDRVTGKVRRMDPTECRFGYRESIFQSPLGSSFIVTRVAVRLSQRGELSLGYKDLAERFSGSQKAPTLAEVREAILEIRGRKFPAPEEFGTAGSFFKNPVVSLAKGSELKKSFPEIPLFATPTGALKTSAAWLVDHVAGMRGYKKGRARTFERQALVIVAERGARAEEVIALAKDVRDRVKERTGIALQPEVQFIGCSWNE